MKSILSFLSVVSITAFSLQAQELKTNSISIFDNGTSFYIKSGIVNSTSGHLLLTEKYMPKALYGTLWFNTTNIKNVSSYSDTLQTSKIARSLKDLIITNNEKKVSLVLDDGITINGVLYVPMNKYNPEEGLYDNLINFIGVKSDDGYKFLNINEVKQIHFLEEPDYDKAEYKITKVLDVEFNNTMSRNNIEMMYLQNGLNWNPNYLLTLLDNHTAQIKFRAEISNRSEDIVNTPINLVVGQPNFVFGSKLSDIVSFLGTIEPHRNNTMAMRSSYMPQELSIISDDSEQNELDYVTNNDMYFYNVKDVTLSKGSSALYDVFSKNVEIKHLYKSSLPQNNTYNISNYNHNFQNQSITHFVELVNQTNHPWVEGSVFIVNNDAGLITPLAQEKLDYTAVNNSNCVKISDTKDISVNYKESIAKQVDSFSGKQAYYELTIDGVISVENFKREDVDMELSKNIVGTLISSSDDWEKNIGVLSQFNYTNSVQWDFKIKKKSKKEIKYTYKVYVKK